LCNNVWFFSNIYVTFILFQAESLKTWRYCFDVYPVKWEAQQMTKSWMSVATFVVVAALVMILHERLPSPVGDLGQAMLNGLDASVDWLRILFSFRA